MKSSIKNLTKIFFNLNCVYSVKPSRTILFLYYFVLFQLFAAYKNSTENNNNKYLLKSENLVQMTRLIKN